MSVSVKKTVALVCALGKLHNFCIDNESDMEVPTPTPADEWESEMGGGVPLVPAPGAQSSILKSEVAIIDRDGKTM